MHCPVPLLLVPLAASPSTQDWARFRGPDGGGDARHVALPELGADSIRWAIHLPGSGSSSPVVLGDRLVVTCMVEGQRTILAYHLGEGEPDLEWSHAEPVAEHSQHRFNSYASATPALDEDGVYVVAADGGWTVALALDHEGQVMWRRELGEQKARHGGGASPVVHDGVLVVAHDDENGAGSFLLGLDTASGEERWRRPRESVRAAYATPCLRTGPAGPELVFASTAHGLTAVDPTTGELRWEIADLFEERVVASPVAVGSIVFAVAGKGGGGIEAAAVEAPASEDDEARVLWRTARNLPYVPTPLAVDGDLVLWSDGGIVSRLRASDGRELWRERLTDSTYASPIRVGEAVVGVSRSGEVLAFAASGPFERLGSLDLGEESDATPAVAQGLLLLRTRTGVLALGQPEETQ